MCYLQWNSQPQHFAQRIASLWISLELPFRSIWAHQLAPMSWWRLGAQDIDGKLPAQAWTTWPRTPQQFQVRFDPELISRDLLLCWKTLPSLGATAFPSSVNFSSQQQKTVGFQSLEAGVWYRDFSLPPHICAGFQPWNLVYHCVSNFVSLPTVSPVRLQLCLPLWLPHLSPILSHCVFQTCLPVSRNLCLPPCLSTLSTHCVSQRLNEVSHPLAESDHPESPPPRRGMVSYQYCASWYRLYLCPSSVATLRGSCGRC